MDLRSIFGDAKARELSHAVGHIIENVRSMGWTERRSWDEFFAEIKRPQWTRKHIEQRIITNFLYYRSNYLLTCVGILSVKIVFAPAVLLSLLMIAFLFIYFFLIVEGDLIFMETTIDLRGKQIICGVGTIIIISISGTMEHILLSLLYGLGFCLLHMIFRPRNITSKMNKFDEEFVSGDSSTAPDLEGMCAPGTRKRSSSNGNNGVSGSGSGSSSSSVGGGDGITGTIPSPRLVAINANHGYTTTGNSLNGGATIKSD